MTEFKREERYIVVKIKDMTPAQRVALRCHLEVHGTPTRECVVVEPDWPIYEIVWHLVERLATGQRLPFMTDDDPDKLKAERDEAFARGKQVFEGLRRVEAERDALEASCANITRQYGEIQEVLVSERDRADALAAHVERLTREIEGALRIKDLWLPAHCDPEHEGECQALGKMHSAFARALEESPTTSLARLVAEHVDAAIGHAEALIEAGATVDEAFSAVRRQAEESE